MINKLKLIKDLLFFLIEIGSLFAFYYFLVGRLLSPPFDLILSTLGSLFVLVSIGNFLSAKAKYTEWQLMKKTLVSKDIAELKDGQKIVIFGQIFPNNGEPIISPFTQEKCILYTYGIYKWVWRGTGGNKKRKKELICVGFYLTPSYVDSSIGKIKLFSFPTLQGFKRRTYSHADKTVSFYSNAETYIQDNQFEEFGKMKISKFGKIYQIVKNILTDDDGHVRKDIKSTTELFDLKTRYLEEQYVKEGETVSLLGIWSSVKQGVVTDVKKTIPVLTKGSPEQAMKTAKKMAFAKLRDGLIFFFAINFIIALFWWIINEGPKRGTVIHREIKNGQVVKEEIVRSTK